MRASTRVVIAVVAAVLAWGPLAEAAAPVGRFTVATDTVKDNVTGLVWQRAVPAASYNWTNAKTYCQGLSLGGFTSGWRLPAVKELSSIVDRRASNPAIDPAAFPATPASGFWTSSAYVATTSGAWVVRFYDGNAGAYGFTYTSRVRCVR